jgi:Ni,Fe-hydrogenase III large subunit
MTEPLDITGLTKGKAPAVDGFVRADVDAPTWTALAKDAASGGADLVSLWADGDRVRMALRDTASPVQLIATLKPAGRSFPSAGLYHAPAIRLERAIRDLYGMEPEGLHDPRAWLDHGAWQQSPASRPESPATKVPPYKFLPVEGPSLHQVPVGPVHAGIIEPGHFRFTASGELVVRLEERLGYVHKGIDALATGADLERAAKLVGRISGDSTVAYAFAFALAVEAAIAWTPPPRAVAIRGIMAEIERVAHHINDVGAICNDASVVAIMAHCTLIREEIVAVSARCFGHRLMMDRIVPGGVTNDLTREAEQALRALLAYVGKNFEPVVTIYDHMASLQDRTVTTGFVTGDLARRFAAGGYVGRASGRTFDARAALRYAPYDALSFEVPQRTAGDVDARVWIRIEEVRQSLAMIRDLLDKLPSGPIHSPRPGSEKAACEGAACVEAFRGDLFLAVRLDPEGRVARLHARDASWFQWPLLEAAIEGNIVADFPLCNKSFNCSYSGHDL